MSFNIMNYMSKTISEATTVELLHAILQAEGYKPGPKRTVYYEPVSETLVAIGPDTVARIRIFDEDMPTLNSMVD